MLGGMLRSCRLQADQALGVLPRAHARIKRRRRSFSSAGLALCVPMTKPRI